MVEQLQREFRATVGGAHAGGTIHSRRACAPRVMSPRRPGTVLPGRHWGLLRDTAAEQTTTLGLRKFAPKGAGSMQKLRAPTTVSADSEGTGPSVARPAAWRRSRPPGAGHGAGGVEAAPERAMVGDVKPVTPGPGPVHRWRDDRDAGPRAGASGTWLVRVAHVPRGRGWLGVAEMRPGSARPGEPCREDGEQALARASV